MAITRKELNPKNYELTPDQEKNQQTLFFAINIIREAWGKPMVVTSGVRTVEDQKRINPKVTKSKHISGAAVDIADPTGELYVWVLKQQKLLEEADLYVELGTKNWVHFQCLSPLSKKRFFRP